MRNPIKEANALKGTELRPRTRLGWAQALADEGTEIIERIVPNVDQVFHIVFAGRQTVLYWSNRRVAASPSGAIVGPNVEDNIRSLSKREGEMIESARQYREARAQRKADNAKRRYPYAIGDEIFCHGGMLDPIHVWRIVDIQGEHVAIQEVRENILTGSIKKRHARRDGRVLFERGGQVLWPTGETRTRVQRLRKAV